MTTQLIELEENLGEPTCSEIVKNPKKASETIPQAWEYKGEWYYNWEGAIRETAYQGKRLPTTSEWRRLIDSGIRPPLAGYCYWVNGQYYGKGSIAYYWSSSPNTSHSYVAYFDSDGGSIAYNGYGANGFSVRCVVNDTIKLQKPEEKKRALKEALESSKQTQSAIEKQLAELEKNIVLQKDRHNLAAKARVREAITTIERFIEENGLECELKTDIVGRVNNL